VLDPVLKLIISHANLEWGWTGYGMRSVVGSHGSLVRINRVDHGTILGGFESSLILKTGSTRKIGPEANAGC
jgi:hypothetical protein